MTFREFADKAFLFPGTIVSKLVDFVFGPTSRNETVNENDEQVKGFGVLGFLLDLVKDIGVVIADFIAEHKKAIAIAFWSSLAVAGLAALTVGFWPAALTAITEYAINGYSIAGLVGTDFTAQLLAVAGVAALATSALVYTTAAIYNTTNSFIGLFAKKNPDVEGAAQENNTSAVEPNSHQRSMSALGTSTSANAKASAETAEPVNFSSVARAPAPKPAPKPASEPAASAASAAAPGK